MTSNEELRKNIMRRVYVTHTLRELASPLAVKLYIFVLLIWQVLMRVSVPDVFANASNVGDLSSLKFFVLTAFAKTELLVQVSVAITLGLIFWMFKDILRHNHTRVA